jgi:hypothetical protein
MLLHFEENIEIAGWATVRPGLALARHAKLRAGIHSGGHTDFQRAFALNARLAAARLAGLSDYLSCTLAGWAGARDRKESLLIGHLPAAAARLASSHASTGLRANPFAGLAIFAADEANLGAYAGGSVLKTERHVVAQIGATLTAGAAPSSGTPVNSLIEAKEIAKDVVEFFKDYGVEAAALESPAAESRMSEAIVYGTLLGIGKNGISLRRHPEIYLGFFFVFGITVRMPLERGLAIGGFNLVGGSVALDAENRVKVSLSIGRHCSPSEKQNRKFDLGASGVKTPDEARAVMSEAKLRPPKPPSSFSTSRECGRCATQDQRSVFALGGMR